MKGEHLAGEHGKDAITVVAGGASWTVRPLPREVVVEDGGSDQPRTLIQGAPQRVLCWLWGRAGDDVIRATGDPAWAGYLRRMLIALTQ
jgi:hypothetical protein